VEFLVELNSLNNMAKKPYNTTLDAFLLKELKVLAAILEIRQNALFEEAIRDLLKKYRRQKGKF